MLYEIRLTRGQKTRVSKSDYVALRKYKWHAWRGPKGFYAARTVYLGNGKFRTIYMARQIMGVKTGARVDHSNGDTLNNLRKNLRLATHSQNAAAFRVRKTKSSSKFRGVGWHRRIGKWWACVCVNYARTHLGYYDDETDAARAYDAAAKRYFKEFASLNFPEEPKVGTI